MARPRLTCVLVLIAVIAFGARGASTAGPEGFQIIVHPDNPVTEVSRDVVRRAYLKKATEWSHGAAFRPIDLPKGSAVRNRFTKDVLKKTPAQLRSYWNQQVFSGKGVPPPEADAAAAIAYVLAHPGGIAYLPADVDPGGAKVIELR